MLKEEKLENTRYIYYIQNIHYIKENNNYYVNVILPNKEFKISLTEGRKLIHKMGKDQLLKRKLAQKGFCGFYRIENGKYQEITFSEYRKKDSEEDMYNKYLNNIKEAAHLKAEERREKMKEATNALSISRQNNRITFERKYDPNYELICRQAHKAKEILNKNTSNNKIPKSKPRPNTINNQKEIEKIYLYEIKPNTEIQCIVFYKNGNSKVKSKDELVKELAEFLTRNNLKSIDQLYEKRIIEEVKEENINYLFEKYSVKSPEDEKNIGKIVLTKEKAIIFYKSGKTELTTREEVVRKIVTLKKAYNIKENEQLFDKNIIECVEKIELYRNFEKYRSQAIESKNTTKSKKQSSEDDSLELIPIYDLKKPENKTHRRKVKKSPNVKDIIKNLIQKFKQNKLVKGITLGTTVFAALGVTAYTYELVYNSITGTMNKKNFSDANNGDLKIMVGNQDVTLKLQNALDELDEEISNAKKRKEKTLAHQTVEKKSTITPQEEEEEKIESILVENTKKATNKESEPVNVSTDNTQTQSINYIATYSLTPEQIDKIKATVQHEAGFNDIEVTAVMSTVINRCRSGAWGGNNPWSVITAGGQFESYFAGYYLEYVNGNYADYTDQIVDQMLSGEKAPIHGYERFSGGGSGVQFTPGGNHYR